MNNNCSDCEKEITPDDTEMVGDDAYCDDCYLSMEASYLNKFD